MSTTTPTTRVPVDLLRDMAGYIDSAGKVYEVLAANAKRKDNCEGAPDMLAYAKRSVALLARIKECEA